MSSTSKDGIVHHSTNGLIVSTVVIELSLGTLAILSRTYTKFRLTRGACHWSYAWAVLSWAGGVFDAVAMLLAVSYGLGVNTSHLTHDAVIQAVKWSWISNATTRIASSCGRAAVVAFILEIQQRTARRWSKVLLWSIAISNLLFNICIMFFMFLRCTPAAFIWDRKIPGGSCPLQKADQYLGYAFAAWGAFSDLFLACYPITIFWNLQMARGMKIGISMLMAMGLLACACAIVVTYQIHAVGDSGDLSYRLARLAVWSTTEMWVILIASSAAPLWPLVRRIPCLQRRPLSLSSESPIKIGVSYPSRTLSQHTDVRTPTLNHSEFENDAGSDTEKDNPPV